MNQHAREIPPERWPQYFNDFSKAHQGWTVTIEVMREDLGDHRVADGLPLQGLSFETKGSEAGDILIEAGDAPDEYMVHHVDVPRRFWIDESRLGTQAVMRIESDDGTITLVSLRPRDELPHARSA